MKEHERKDYERLRAEGRWPEARELRGAEATSHRRSQSITSFR